MTTKIKRNGPGRPTGGDSDATRRRLVDVARSHFARLGYASTALNAIAVDADLTPAAVYYYFSGKAELYEAVYHASAPIVWDAMESAAAAVDTMVGAVAAIVGSLDNSDAPTDNHRFLAVMPTIAQLHPEFDHLLDDRYQYHERLFRSLAERGAATGELGPLSIDEGTEFLRIAVMGYFFERYHRPSRLDHSAGPLLAALRALAAAP